MSCPASMWDVLVYLQERYRRLGRQRRLQTRGSAGPIGIAQIDGRGGQEPAWGRVDLSSLMALISISLGIVNMLPIPALDGGRFMFVLIEWVRRGKRISPEREGLVHLVGLRALLIGFIVFITYFDIVYVIWNGDSFIR